LGSHLIDQVLVLFGRPDRVSAHIYNSRKTKPADFDDAFFAHFFYDRHGSDGLPLVVAVRGSPLSLMEPQLRFTVKGTKASFVKYGIDTQEDQRKLNPPMSTDDSAFGLEPESIQGTLTTIDANGGFKTERVFSERGRYLSWYENVGLALSEGDPAKLYVKADEARETIHIIELMYQSSREGRTILTTDV